MKRISTSKDHKVSWNSKDVLAKSTSIKMKQEKWNQKTMKKFSKIRKTTFWVKKWSEFQLQKTIKFPETRSTFWLKKMVDIKMKRMENTTKKKRAVPDGTQDHLHICVRVCFSTNIPLCYCILLPPPKKKNLFFFIVASVVLDQSISP